MQIWLTKEQTAGKLHVGVISLTLAQALTLQLPTHPSHDSPV